MEFVRKSAEEALGLVSPVASETADEALVVLREGDVSHAAAAACDLFRPGSEADDEDDPLAQVRALVGHSKIPLRSCGQPPPRRWRGLVARPKRQLLRSSPR